MNKISSYLQYNWYKYLIIFFAVLVCWSIIYNDIDQVGYDESVKILFIGENLEENKIKEDIWNNINNITQQDLEYVSVLTYSADEDTVYEYLRGKVYSVDIVIISGELLNIETASQIFAPITLDLKGKFINEFVSIEGKSYGLKFNQNSKFSEFYSGDAVLFLSPYSLNLSKAYGYGEEKNDAAISIAKYLLEEAME